MESAAAEMNAERNEHRATPADREHAISRVEAYLRAWRIGPAERVRNCAREIVATAERRAAGEQSRLLAAALEEADVFLATWFRQFGTGEFDRSEQINPVSINQRSELLFGAPSHENWSFSDRTQLLAAFRQGSLNFNAALKPARPPETRAFTMQTSLSRLPSIRLIAGWIVLVALLFLTFVLTHQRI